MDIKKRIEELEEHRRLLLIDLKNLQIIERKIGKTPHQAEMLDKFLEQLSDVLKELKRLKNEE